VFCAGVLPDVSMRMRPAADRTIVRRHMKQHDGRNKSRTYVSGMVLEGPQINYITQGTSPGSPARWPPAGLRLRPKRTSCCWTRNRRALTQLPWKICLALI
jgi:hypothetical protein